MENLEQLLEKPSTPRPAGWNRRVLFSCPLVLVAFLFMLFAVAADATASGLDSALAHQLQPASQPLLNQPLTFREKATWVAFVIACIFGVVKLGPKFVRLFRSKASTWEAAGAQADDASSKALAEQRAFAKFAETLRTNSAASARALQPQPAAQPAPSKTDPTEARPSEPGRLKDYFAKAPAQLAALRAVFAQIDQPSNESRQATVAGLHRDLQSFKNSAFGLPEVLPVWQLAAALEGLLKQLTDKPATVTPSTLRTAGSALALLEQLSRPGLKHDLVSNPRVRLLAVDDDPISRVAVSTSLKKVFEQPDLANDGAAALVLAEKNTYDIVFLDVEMPGMDGYEVCSKIHETVANRTTPIVFVTCHSDFESRAKSTRSGGQDLIGKPFLSFEITVKALTLLLEKRLEQHSRIVAASTEAVSTNSGAENKVASSQPAPAAPLAGTTVLLDKQKVPAAPESSAAATPRVPRDQAKSFFAQAPAHIEALRTQLQTLTYAGPDNKGPDHLGDVYVSMHWLTTESERAELRAASRLSSTLQALLKKLLENRKHVTTSTLTAATDAVEVLEELCLEGKNPDLSNPEIAILVVDDDPIARRSISSAIQLVFAKPDSADTGEEALAKALEKAYDAIFLDVQMPGMDGFVACSKIHETTLNDHSPVVFITSHSDTASRDKATAAGGYGFIPKPALAIEITLRALTLALRGRLDKSSKPELTAAIS